MNPLRLQARNYRSFSDLDVTFPEGCTAVIGPNGAGKSTIVGAIDLALFGSRSIGDYLTEGIDEPLQIELEFEHRNELYRVRRTYSPKGRGQTKLDFERAGYDESELRAGIEVARHGVDPGMFSERWHPLTRETAAATQALIEETIGLSRETFRASAFLAQGDGAAFTEAQPRERKAILAEVLGLGIWDELLQLAKTDRGRLEQTGNRLQAELERAHAELGQQPLLEAKRSELGEQAEALQDALARAEAEKAEAQNALTAGRETAASFAGAKDLLAERVRAVTAAGARLAEMGSHEADARPSAVVLAELREQASRAPALEQELETRRERDRRVKDWDRLQASYLALREKVSRLTATEAERCDRCGQELDADARQRALASYDRELEGVSAQQAELLPLEPDGTLRREDVIVRDLGSARTASTSLAELETRAARAETIAEHRAQLKERIPELQRAVDEAQATLDALGPHPEIGRLEAALTRAQAQSVAQRSLLDSTRQALAVAEAKLAELAELAHTTEGTTAALRGIQAELDVVLLAERAYGRDGIPALIVENAAIPQIETEANRILAELGTSFTVELRTQRALKSGEGLKESLDIVVAGPIGARPYETFSGGERTRLNLALRIALARLLAHRRGAEVRMLAIDEPEFLDEAGVARLAEVLRGLSADFDRILLVSHVPGLRDAFDQALEVEKVGERSRLVGAPEREVVLA